jgi:hypothetical protein
MRVLGSRRFDVLDGVNTPAEHDVGSPERATRRRGGVTLAGRDPREAALKTCGDEEKRDHSARPDGHHVLHRL